MDEQIRALTTDMSNVRVLDVTNQKQLVHSIRSTPPKAAILQGHHAPSITSNDLAQMCSRDLQENHRHLGRVITVKIDSIEYKSGALLTCSDPYGAEDDEVMVWSLLLRPVGRELQVGAILVIHEPYFGKCPLGQVAVCIHHPSDCRVVPDGSTIGEVQRALETWSSSAGQPASSGMPMSIMPRLCGIEVRPSTLGGRGMFATQKIAAGDLLLCERPLALYTGADSSAYGVGIEDILPGKLTNARKLALLQQIVDKVAPNELLRRKFFELYAGVATADPAHAKNGPDIFNSYTALSIVKHNAHIIFPGNTSDHHDLANKAVSGAKLTPADQRSGIWLEASMVNHSCLPNAVWSWVGEMFIMRANCDIAMDEEVTVAYVPSSYPVEKRKSTLQAANEFACRCTLCVADSTAVPPQSAQEALQKAQHLQRLSGSNKVEEATLLVRDAIACYPLDDYCNLPCPQLAEPLLQLGHLILAKYPKEKWSSAPSEARGKARDCFIACLEFGLGSILVEHTSPSGLHYHLELLNLGHCQSRPVGVLALMALAELAYLAGSKYDRGQCVPLKALAKKMYGVCYGEDRTFAGQHQYYTCVNVEDDPAGIKRDAKFEDQWERAKRQAREEGRMWPKWLVEE